MKRLTRQHGLGLMDARHAVERHRAGHAAGGRVDRRERDTGAAADRQPLGQALPANVVMAAQSGDTLEAIRLLVSERGVGLRAAKRAVDDYLADNGGIIVAGDSIGTGRLIGAAIVIALILVVYWWVT